MQESPAAGPHMAMTPLLRPPALLSILAVCAATPLRADCDVRGSASTPEDVVLALAACDSARARFAALFGESAPAALVVLHDKTEYEVGLSERVGVVFWPNGAALRDARSDPAAHWREVLPHELMHALTMARFFADARAVDHDGYGTPLPDWFEEALGIWGEPAESRNARLAHAQRLPAPRLDLATILRSAHPAGADASIMAPVPGAPLPRDEALRAFYPQAIAVLSFVHDAGGTAAVRELAARLVRNPADAQALAGLPGLPTTMNAVTQAWEAWLRPFAAP